MFTQGALAASKIPFAHLRDIRQAERGSCMKPDREEQIRARAYEIWIAEGKPEGLEQLHWQLAEQEMALAAAEPNGVPDTPAPPQKSPRRHTAKSACHSTSN